MTSANLTQLQSAWQVDTQSDFQVCSREITLRDYQEAAVKSVWRDLSEDKKSRPLVVVPTGGGKTPVIAELARRVAHYGHRVLVLSHVKELVGQSAGTLERMFPDLDVGILSAGLGSRDVESQIVVGGIQTAVNHANDFSNVKLILCDEAHRIPRDGEGQYRKLLSDLPNARLVGLTATPYRLRGGLIYGSDDSVFSHLCHETGIGDLTDGGYLSPIKYKGSGGEVDTSDLSVNRGEFVASQVAELVNDDDVVRTACAEIVHYATDRQACLIFCHSVDHGEHVQSVVRELGQNVAAVFGRTPSGERDQIVTDFKARRIKFLVNVEVLTTGFDATHIDQIALLRPTFSPGLFYQMVGRGLRIHPGKANCLLLDFAQNVARHGFVDNIKPPDTARQGTGQPPVKKCGQCHELVAAGCRTCPVCDYDFPAIATPKHSATADVLIETLCVELVSYYVHSKAGSRPSMRVEYQCGNGEIVSEWVCLEHVGYPRHKAKLWWFARCRSRFPDSAAEAIDRAHLLKRPTAISVKRARRWPEIVSVEFA